MALSPDLLGPLRLPRHPFRMARFGLVGLRSAARAWPAPLPRLPRAGALRRGSPRHSFLPLDRIPTAAFGLMLGVTGHAVGWPLPEGGAQRSPTPSRRCSASSGGEIHTGRLVKSLDELPRARAYLFDLTPAQLLRIERDALAGRATAGGSPATATGRGCSRSTGRSPEPIPWRAEACRRAGTVHLGGTMEEIAASERAAWHGRDAAALRPGRPAEPVRSDPRAGGRAHRLGLLPRAQRLDGGLDRGRSRRRSSASRPASATSCWPATP